MMLSTDESLRRRHRRLLNAATAVIESAAPGDDVDHATVPICALQTLQRELAENEPQPYATMSVT
jgi:hypothetical protein